MKTALQYDHYFNYQEITDILHEFAEKNPDSARLISIGKTTEGREMWVLEITNTAEGDFDDKPAYMAIGHVHAGEVTGSMCAMYLADVLLNNQEEEQVASLLKNSTFYIMPRPVADGSEYYLTHPDMIRSINVPYPFESEMPGLVPADLDGDGVIRNMIVKTPFGVWKKDPQDSRLLIRRQADETEGDFYNVYSEGMINDYDGVHISPAPQKYGLDLNRNYPMNWNPEYKQPGGGMYPGQVIESRNLIEWISTRRNLVSTIIFHTFGGMYLYPPAGIPAAQADQKDQEMFKAFMKIAKEETGYHQLRIKDDFLGIDSKAPANGSLDDYLYHGNGVFCHSVETWNLAEQCGMVPEYPKPKKLSEEDETENQRKLLEWTDNNGLNRFYKEWTEFDHPQLGKVEIGGPDKKYLLQNPPVQFLMQEVEKHTRYILRHARTMPHLVFSQTTTEKLADGLYKVEAVLGNTGFMPTYATSEFLNLKLARDIEVTLEGAEIADGKKTQKIGQLEGFASVKANYSFFGPSTFETSPLQKKICWYVHGEEGTAVTLTAESQKAGKAQVEVTLK
ncbi:MAG: zinc carboxypeptidase [Solobacterium sp.]|nr:zinc carboxypeptidase [Solobacterium sp.]